MQSSRLYNYTISYENSEEYHHLKREVVSSNLYYFEADTQTPYIIDAGAHIGLSTLYFKQLYPEAEIVALEPNPRSFELLETNLFENQIEGVQTLQLALSNKAGQEELFFDNTPELWHSTASFHNGSWAGTQNCDSVVVQTQTLTHFITKPVDFLKLDIEGSEQKVLSASQHVLHKVKELQVEFHPHATQNLAKVVELLEKTHTVVIYKGTNNITLKKAIEKDAGLVYLHATLHPKKRKVLG